VSGPPFTHSDGALQKREGHKWRRSRRPRALCSSLSAWIVLLLVGVAALARPTRAGELGHYFPGAFNVRDYILPDKGLYAAVYGIYYGSNDLRDRSGHEISSIPLPGGSADVDTDLDLYSIVPAVLWNSGWKVIGAEYGAYAALPFGGPSLSASLSTPIGFGTDSDTSAFGLQDLFLQPLWLRWSFEHVDLSFAYGIYAPSGHYNAGDPDNIGMGFWTNQFQLAGAYYLLDRATALVLAGTYEINGEQEDTDITPGQRLTLNYGISQFLPWGPGLVDLGVMGYSQWQVTHDRGSNVASFNSHLDQVHAIGAELGYALPKLGLGVTGKYLYEYYAESRFRGHVLTLSVGYEF